MRHIRILSIALFLVLAVLGSAIIYHVSYLWHLLARKKT